MDTNTTADEVAYNKRYVLRQITSGAESLRRALEDAKKDISRALTALDEGRKPNGTYTGGFGPLGHQAPFDITVATNKVSHAIEMASMLGISEEEIATAYRNGSIDAETRAVEALRARGIEA